MRNDANITPCRAATYSNRGRRRSRRGFTLIELLVVITVIAMLFGILIPGLTRSRDLAKRTACLAGLQQIGVAISTYAMENRGSIPYGPKAAAPSATNFYPWTGMSTSLVSLEDGRPVGLGLMLKDHLPDSEESLFCPGADERWDTKESLALVGKAQVESSYYYRHASVYNSATGKLAPMTKLDRLGTNRDGKLIRALVMDTQFTAPGKMALFNLRTRTHHKQRIVNALYSDGHASTFQNANDRFKVKSNYQSMERILSIFEDLDDEQ